MKKVIGIFFLLLSMSAFLSSCEKDVENLPGKWEAVYATVDGVEVDNLKDVWIFRIDGTCTIDCDFQKYFNSSYYGIITINGKYNTRGNERLTIESDKFHESLWGYDLISYDLDIDELSKSSLMVRGKVNYCQYEENITNRKSVDVSLQFKKK